MRTTKDMLARTVAACLTAGAILLPVDALYAQSSNHTVTVQVSSITAVQVTSGTVTLNITNAEAVAGQDQMTVSDQSTSLLWGINSGNRKITASSNLASPVYTLELVAVNPTRGSAQPQFTLNALPHDLLHDVGRSSGTCVLRYTGTAFASQGTGSDLHTITFTVQAQ